MFCLLIGGDAVRVYAHILVACHVVVYDMEEKGYKCHVNRMSEFLCAVGGAMDMTVLMHGGVQGDIVYMCDKCGVHGKLYVEVEGLDALWLGNTFDQLSAGGHWQ